jgi:predicted NBD/HSP70 family sugar kinase
VPDGPQCNCGNRGCWETLVGPTAIVRQVRQAVATERSPKLSLLGNGNVGALRMEQVLNAAAQGDPVVLEVLNEVGRYLGIGIANLINIFNPGLVVLGGVLSPAGPYLLRRAQQEVNVRALAAPRKGVEIIVSTFKFDACVMGGVSLILRRILGDPVAWQSQRAPGASSESSLVLRRSAL